MNKTNLTRIADFIKTKAFILIASLIVSIIISSSAFLYLKSPSRYSGVAWQNNIIPGQTTVIELENKLGPPIKTEQEENMVIYSYDSGNQFRPHVVETINNKVYVAKEQVIGKEKGALNDYWRKYGRPEKILYGKHGFAAPANFWGDKGLVIFGNPTSGLIIEIWYFTPTTLDNFLEENPGFTTTVPENF